LNTRSFHTEGANILACAIACAANRNIYLNVPGSATMHILSFLGIFSLFCLFVVNAELRKHVESHQNSPNYLNVGELLLANRELHMKMAVGHPTHIPDAHSSLLDTLEENVLSSFARKAAKTLQNFKNILRMDVFHSGGNCTGNPLQSVLFGDSVCVYQTAERTFQYYRADGKWYRQSYDDSICSSSSAGRTAIDITPGACDWLGAQFSEYILPERVPALEDWTLNFGSDVMCSWESLQWIGVNRRSLECANGRTCTDILKNGQYAHSLCSGDTLFVDSKVSSREE